MTQQTAENIAKEVLDSLNQDMADLKLLLGLLNEERACLEVTEHDKLDVYTEKKSAVCNLLDERAKQRAQKLSLLTLRCGNSAEWQQTLVALQPTKYGSDLRVAWDKTEGALQECDKAMRINEKIVSSLLQSARQFISALRVTDNSSEVYDASGRTSSNTGKLEFVQA